ncbi:uncharacterized protein LOC132696131 isoform X2 [Cylas formicarius]|uniref:uncharacterized protein LOC132696131 isoform X2 n=1 Tax=Cylas formicarius TaxID=197179 RepID=UPI002958A23A|nr:uncharacterized protein LOC132696131 isoform X2 [Cylas formicarius]
MILRQGGAGPPWLVTVFVCIYLVIVCSDMVAADKSKSYSMQTLCKNHFLQQLYRKIDGAVLYSQNERNLDCVITFQTHSILQRFMLRFDGLQLDCNDHLYIYDGAHAVGTYKFDLSCKNTKQTLGAMFTRTNYVTLKYTTDAWGTDSNGFKLVITAVKDPKHACTEFRCTLREFCISTDLVCDEVNHCADGSDESSNNLCQNNEKRTILGLAVTWFVVVVISTVLVFLVLIVAVSICICRRGWNSRSGNVVQQQNASYSCQMYGSNGHVMKQASSTTTLADAAGACVPPSSGNWRRPVGPPGFRNSTPPAREQPYCPAG